MARHSPAAEPQRTLPPEGTEAAARLASIRQALRAADMMAGSTTEQLAAPVDVAEVWPLLSPSAKRCFANRSERLANAAGAGLAMFEGGPLNPAAAERLAAELRVALPHIERLLERR